MLHKISTLMLGLAQASQHPVVQASGLVVDIEVENNNDYYGPLFIGERFDYLHMVYDTTCG